MTRLILFCFGIVFLIFGVIFALLPMIPLGVPFLALSLLCLIPVSPTVRNGIRFARIRSAFVNRLVEGAIKFLPSTYSRVLRATDPDGF